MITSRKTLTEAIKNHQSPYEDEVTFCERFLYILQQSGCYKRENLPGHITGSSWIIDTERKHVLLTHHAKLNKWLQPGGHADGDENILGVALREAEEETGLKALELLNPLPFDLDIHIIPARDNFPEHFHYDVRFIFGASINDILHVSHESNDLKWISLSEIELYTDNASILRMKQKTLQHFR